MQEQLPRVLSVPFPLRFLFASQPVVMGKVLGIVYRTIATHLTGKSGCTKTTSQTGAVTLTQRFGSALNLNIHFHMLFLDGLTKLTHTIAQRTARYLERQGLLERDGESSCLFKAMHHSQSRVTPFDENSAGAG